MGTYSPTRALNEHFGRFRPIIGYFWPFMAIYGSSKELDAVSTINLYAKNVGSGLKARFWARRVPPGLVREHFGLFRWFSGHFWPFLEIYDSSL